MSRPTGEAGENKRANRQARCISKMGKQSTTMHHDASTPSCADASAWEGAWWEG